MAQEIRTKKQIIQKTSQKNGKSPKEVQLVIQDLFNYVSENLSGGNRFEFRDFEIVRRKQKIGRNPKKPDSPIVIPERNSIKFTPGKKVKSLVENS